MRKLIQKSAIFAACFFMLGATAFSQQAVISTKTAISGKITDYSSRRPLQAANIFLAGTTIGTSSDSTGSFTLANVPFGTHELIVSYVGYEVKNIPLRITEAKDMTMNFRMKRKIIKVPEIAVSASEVKDWQKNFKKFKELFLGTSQNAAECEFQNPEVLDFIPQKGSTPFQAFAKEPLILDNKALGYRVYYLLSNFEAKHTYVQYYGKAAFYELEPTTRKQEIKWQKNRLETYRGSMKHFMASLYDNTLKKEGYLAYQLPHFPQPGEEHTINKKDLRTKNVLSPGELDFEKKLRFQNYIEVINAKEMEPDEYIKYRIDIDPELINASFDMRQQAEQAQNQRSLIALKEYEVIVDSVGNIDKPLAVDVYGYWSWERIAEMMPTNYEAPFYTLDMMLADDKRDYFGEGEAKRKSGDWQGALEIWKSGKESMEIRGKADPRIGFSFIELATDKKAVEHYEDACEIYMWGLSTQFPKKYKKELTAEFEKIAPLLAKRDANGWEKDAKKADKSILDRMRAFWIEKDPTPTSLYNERLIEHWQRIAHARASFVKTKSTVYGTDDRGLVYVKLGPPNRSRSLILGKNMAELNRIFGETYNDNGVASANSSPNSGAAQEDAQQSDDDVAGGLPPGKEIVDRQAPTPTTASMEDSRSTLEFEVAKYNKAPECELWGYTEFDDNRTTIYIFGTEGGDGSFGLRNGVEEFIPSSAFSRSSARLTFGILPGTVIQMLYYQDLAAFDNYFADRFRQLDDMWIRTAASGQRAPNMNLARGARQSFLAEDQHAPLHRFAPLDQSDFRKSFQPIQMITTQARFLNELNEPVMNFVTFAFPQNLSSFKTDEMLNVEVSFKHDLKYSLIVRDDEFSEMERLTAEPVAELDHTAVFSMPHNPEHAQYTVAVEAFSQSQSGDAENLPGIGQAHFAGLSPLVTDKKKLEMSDLVLGVEPPANTDPGLLPYPIVPSNRIWKVDNLMVYMEVYHLKLNSGEGKYSADFRVFKVKGRGEKAKREEMVASQFEFTSATETSKEPFGVSVSNLSKGDYELEVEIRDKNSGQKQTRIAKFEVREK